jgi:hypothetical protein
MFDMRLTGTLFHKSACSSANIRSHFNVHPGYLNKRIVRLKQGAEGGSNGSSQKA